jgi:hypothetical protein
MMGPLTYRTWPNRGNKKLRSRPDKPQIALLCTFCSDKFPRSKYTRRIQADSASARYRAIDALFLFPRDYHPRSL